MALFVIDTGHSYDRPVQKGQWAVSDIPTGGVEILNAWLKEKTEVLIKELRYAKLEGTGKIDVRPLHQDFDIDIEVSVTIRPAKKKPAGDVKRKAQR